MGYLLKEASIDQPFEEDACRCHFTFVQNSTLSTDPHVVLNYQWFVGERMLSDFAAIPDATEEVMKFCIVIIIFEHLNFKLLLMLWLCHAI